MERKRIRLFPVWNRSLQTMAICNTFGYHQRFFFIGSIYVQKKSLKCWKMRSSQVTLISLNVSAWKVKHARYCSRKVSIRIVRFWQYRIDCKSLHFHWLRWIRDNLLCTFKNHKPERHDANVPSFSKWWPWCKFARFPRKILRWSYSTRLLCG